MNNFPSVFESIKDLDFQQIEGLLSLALKFKKREIDSPPFINKTPIIATSFLENSTRTKHSFAIAIQKLGCMYIDFNADTSSLKKGESLEETLLTLHCQGVDACVIRTSVSRELAKFKDRPPLKIINGGDGIHEHPTQAMLDLFTLKEISEDLGGKTLTIIGDVVHSRVSHSLIELLPQFGMNLILAGPKQCIPAAGEYPGIEITTDLDYAAERSDFLYTLRIQKERHKGEDSSYYDSYHQTHGLSLDRLRKLNKKDIPVLHPGPVNIGVELSLDLVRSANYQGYTQVENSIPMRMAIIQAILSNNDKNVGRPHGERS